MVMSNDTCQISPLQLPENMTVEDVARAFDDSSVELTPKTQFFLKQRKARLGKKERNKLLDAVQSVCDQTQLVTTRDFEVNETQFEKYKKGEVIFIPEPRSERACTCTQVIYIYLSVYYKVNV